jgi:hypothetical protein
VFPFSTPDSLHKWMAQIRRSAVHKLPFLLEKNLYTLKGQDKTRYRVSLYSLRRFAFTFHYYVSFNEDVVSLARNFGHSKIETTYNYYVFPKQSIGLQGELTVDQLLRFKPLNDRQLSEFVITLQRSARALLVPGQRCLSDFSPFNIQISV